MNHTPGPWKWDGDDLWHIGISYDDKNDPHLYTGINKDTELDHSPILKANARLIASAPELLEALKQIQTIVMGSKAQMENQIRFVWSTARKAITKAQEA